MKQCNIKLKDTSEPYAVENMPLTSIFQQDSDPKLSWLTSGFLAENQRLTMAITVFRYFIEYLWKILVNKIRDRNFKNIKYKKYKIRKRLAQYW